MFGNTEITQLREAGYTASWGQAFRTGVLCVSDIDKFLAWLILVLHVNHKTQGINVHKILPPLHTLTLEMHGHCRVAVTSFLQFMSSCNFNLKAFWFSLCGKRQIVYPWADSGWAVIFTPHSQIDRWVFDARDVPSLLWRSYVSPPTLCGSPPSPACISPFIHAPTSP